MFTSTCDYIVSCRSGKWWLHQCVQVEWRCRV